MLPGKYEAGWLWDGGWVIGGGWVGGTVGFVGLGGGIGGKSSGPERKNQNTFNVAAKVIKVFVTDFFR